MDVAEIKKAIKRVIKDHAQAFRDIGFSQPKLLELAAITGLAQHYESHGYTVTVINPKAKKSFAIKTGTRGYPWNFSRIAAVRTDRKGDRFIFRTHIRQTLPRCGWVVNQRGL
jgi:hypothetical protein